MGRGKIKNEVVLNGKDRWRRRKQIEGETSEGGELRTGERGEELRSV